MKIIILIPVIDNYKPAIRLIMLKSIALGVLIFCQVTMVLAQNSLDVLNISGRYGFPTNYEGSYSEKATEFGTFLNLALPIVLSENTIWYNSLNHFYFNVDGDPAIPTGVINPIQINGIILRTGLYQKFGDGKGIQLLFAPRLMSDMKNITGESFQFGGVFLYENKFNTDLTMSFGAMYNQEKFGPYLVPIVNVNWLASEKWRIKGMMPVTLKVNYLANDNLTLGFSHFGLITSYYLGSPEYAGDYVERSSIDLSLFARQRIAGNVFVEGKVGRTMGRSYAQYAGDQKVDFSIPLVGFGDERVAKNTDFEDGFFVDVSLVYSIPIPD